MESSFQIAEPNETFLLPALAVFPSGRMDEAPYSFNESWYRILFRRVEWGRSGNKKKTRASLGGRRSQISLVKGGAPMDVWAPDEHMSSNTTLQGQFADDAFSYVEVIVEPCYVYEKELWETTNRRCAPTNDIHAFFCTTGDHCSNKYNTLGFYLLNRQTLAYAKWDSLFYVNLEPQLWIGVEVILRAVSARSVGIWGAWSLNNLQNTTWLKFQDWYSQEAQQRGTRQRRS